MDSVIVKIIRARGLVKCPFCGEELWGMTWNVSRGPSRCHVCGAPSSEIMANQGRVTEEEDDDKQVQPERGG